MLNAFNPSYLEWLVINIDDFILDIDSFERLPDPTPHDNYRAKLTIEEAEYNRQIAEKYIENNEVSNVAKIIERTTSIHGTGYPTSVAQAISAINKGYKLKSIKYQFPKEITELNRKKINKKCVSTR